MNKIIVSIVFAVILVLGINKITDVIFYVEKPEKSAYQVASVTTVESTTSTEKVQQVLNLEILWLYLHQQVQLKVQKFLKNVQLATVLLKEEKNKIGPALWGVLGRQAGSVPDYKYSKAMAAYGKNWSFEEMNGFLIKPKDWIKELKCLLQD